MTRVRVKWLFTLIVGVLCIATLNPADIEAKCLLSSKKITLKEGQQKSISVKNTKKRVVWKILSGKKVISLRKKGKTKAYIVARKAGKANVQAKVGKQKIVCHIVVKKKTQKESSNKTSGETQQSKKEVVSQTIELYAISSSYSKVKIPDSYAQSYQICLADGSKASYRVVSGKSASVTSTGLIQPAYKVWYWNGSVGSTFSSGKEDETQTIECKYGTTVIEAESEQKIYQYTVMVKNYAETYADKVMNNYISTNITDAMTDMEKLKKIAEFPCQYDYSVKQSSAVGMIIDGGGDCWASTNAIVQLSRKVGFAARSRDARGESPIPGNAHMNALVKIDGRLYVVESGYNEKAPRTYTIREIAEYEYDVNEEQKSVTITKYNGLDNHVRIPEVIESYPVTEIGEGAFYGRCEVRTVTLPESLKKIGVGAFAHTGLQSAKIPQGVTDIGGNAFSSMIDYHGPSGSWGSVVPVEVIQLPSSIECIGLNLSDTVVLYEGTESEWSKINGCSENARVFYSTSGLEISQTNIVASTGEVQTAEVYSLDSNVMVTCSDSDVAQVSLESEKKPYNYYRDNSGENVVKVAKKLTVKALKEGTAVVTVTTASAVKQISLTVNPSQKTKTEQNGQAVTAPAKVGNVSIKSSKGKRVVLSWKKISDVEGYEIQYSTNRKWRGKKTKRTTKTQCVVKKMKKEKTYYMRVRAYKTVAGKKVYGAWSKTIHK